MKRKAIRERLKECILGGSFIKTRTLYPQFTYRELERLLVEIATPYKKIENMISYSYLCFLLLEEERKEWHVMAANLFAGPLLFVHNADSATRYHLTRAIELAPDDVVIKKHLLMFYATRNIAILFHDDELGREQGVHINEMKALAQDILKQKPRDLLAKQILKLGNNDEMQHE